MGWLRWRQQQLTSWRKACRKARTAMQLTERTVEFLDCINAAEAAPPRLLSMTSMQ